MNKKYFRKNKKTRYHPALVLSEGKKYWVNMDLTDSPTRNNRYIKLKNNPNLNSRNTAYLKKHLNVDPIRTRGDCLKKYKLSEYDENQVDDFIKQHFARKKDK